MKEKELPQDDANMLEGRTRELQYVVDENGNYTTGKSVGWETKNFILQQAWDDLAECAEEAREKVLAGKRSPIYYYMVKNQMNIKLLSEYVGFNWLKVWLHIRPLGFKRLSHQSLGIYAAVFNLSDVLELLDFNKNQK